MTTAYPPCQHHTITSIPTSEALFLLSAYLEATKTDPSLHPNALLTEHGPVAPQTGTSTGIVLHNLRRVEAGLRGENLGEDLAFENHGGHGLPELPHDGVVQGAGVGAREASGNVNGEVEMEGQWQDKGEFEREQEVIQGDMAVDGGVEQEGGEVPKVRATWGDVETRKEAKKEAKKRRRSKERKAREAKRKREKDAEV